MARGTITILGTPAIIIIIIIPMDIPYAITLVMVGAWDLVTVLPTVGMVTHIGALVIIIGAPLTIDRLIFMETDIEDPLTLFTGVEMESDITTGLTLDRIQDP